MNALIIARAIQAHQNVNQYYGHAYPYSVHLAMVTLYAQRFIHLVPEPKREIVMSACWLHDVIEDARLTYNDVAKFAGYEVADIVYAVTNEKGKNRAERANHKYYEGIRLNQNAIFVKLCDRLANVDFSKDYRDNMFYTYKKENTDFLNSILPENSLTGHHFQDMVTELNALLNTNP